MLNTLISLYLTFLKIGTFAFGGGLAVLAMIEKEVVINQGWLTKSQYTELVSISEMTPGPIAINSATFVGAQIAGIPGAIAATAGVVSMSLLLMSVLAKLLMRYQKIPQVQSAFTCLRPAVAALVMCAGISMGMGTITELLPALLCAVSFVLVSHYKVNPILIILGGAVAGLTLM